MQRNKRSFLSISSVSLTACRAKDKADAEVARKASWGELTKEELRNLKRGRRRGDVNRTPSKRSSMTTNLVSPSGAISDDALASQMDGRIALNEKKLALKEKKMMMELQQQRMEDKEREYKMQENIMQFMTAVMNRLPDTDRIW